MYLESWGNKKETRAWNRKNKNFPVDKKSAVYRKKRRANPKEDKYKENHT